MADLPPEPNAKEALVSLINRVKAIEDEIGDLRADIAEICKDARDSGYDSKKIREVVAKLRKIDKHGRDKVEEADQIFELYWGVHQGGAKNIREMMPEERDRAILDRFAPDDQTDAKLSQRRKSMHTAMAMAKAAKEARGG